MRKIAVVLFVVGTLIAGLLSSQAQAAPETPVDGADIVVQVDNTCPQYSNVCIDLVNEGETDEVIELFTTKVFGYREVPPNCTIIGTGQLQCVSSVNTSTQVTIQGGYCGDITALVEGLEIPVTGDIDELIQCQAPRANYWTAHNCLTPNTPDCLYVSAGNYSTTVTTTVVTDGQLVLWTSSANGSTTICDDENLSFFTCFMPWSIGFTLGWDNATCLDVNLAYTDENYIEHVLVPDGVPPISCTKRIYLPVITR